MKMLIQLCFCHQFYDEDYCQDSLCFTTTSLKFIHTYHHFIYMKHKHMFIYGTMLVCVGLCDGVYCGKISVSVFNEFRAETSNTHSQQINTSHLHRE